MNMKATVKAKELSTLLKQVAPIVCSRTSIDILKTVRLTANKGALQVMACNGESWAGGSIPTSNATDGSMLVAHKTLLRIVAAIPHDDVTLSFDTMPRLVSGGIDLRLCPIGTVEDFPNISRPPMREAFSTDADELNRAVRLTRHAVSDDRHRQILTGYHFEIGDVSRIVSTDTHRLACASFSATNYGSFQKTIPNKVIDAVVKSGIPGECKVSFSESDTAVIFEVDGLTVGTLPLAGIYPNWQRVVPENETRTVTVEKSALAAAIKRTLQIAKDNANQVRFKFTALDMTISGRAAETGEYQESMPWETRNGNLADFEIAFNGRYMLDICKRFSGDTFTWHMTESGRPVKFTGNVEDGFEVLMPMSLA